MKEEARRETGGTRERILHQSCRLFALKGFEGTAVSEVCRMCEITKPSLYYHFDGKDDLFLSCLEHSRESFFTALSGSIGYSGDLIGNIRALFSDIFGFAHTNPWEYRLVLTTLFSGEESAERRISQPLLTGIMEQFAAFFSQAALDHGNLKGREAALAASFLAQSMGVRSLLNEAASPPNDDDLTRITQSFMYGIF